MFFLASNRWTCVCVFVCVVCVCVCVWGGGGGGGGADMKFVKTFTRLEFWG